MAQQNACCMLCGLQVHHITGDSVVHDCDGVSNKLPCRVVGHITGRHDSHRSLTACPLYHNMSADECKACSLQSCHLFYHRY